MQSFRVFVSSTFEDMRAEREALHAGVFPSVTEYCAARGARFQAIDLRWGISDGDSRARQTMRICLDEMRRACDLSPQLYLLVLLGNRYGWRPMPWRVPAADFDALLAAARSHRAAFTAWYDRDDNAVPAEYRLRDRPRGARAPSEQELRAILDEALAAFVPRGDPRWVAYAGSAVHQEIAEARRHAGDARGALCYVRDPRPEPEPPSTHPSLGELEEELRGWLASSASSYSAAPTLEQFCQGVERALKQRVDAALHEMKGGSDLGGEIAAHAQFARERIAGFHGRRTARRRIHGYLTNTSDRPFVIAGAAGSGKSALMAQCAADARAALPGAAILQRFVGATASSSDLRSLLDGLRDEIAGAFDAPLQPPADDVETAIPRWIEALRTGQEQRALVIFLDAVDQVENRDGVDLLDWLPRHLPPQTKLVASLAEPDESTDTGHDGMAGSTSLQLSGLSWPEARNALRAWMRSARRTIQPAQERAIQARFAHCPLPLFLKLAFERARGWTSGDRRVRVAHGLDGIVDAALDEFELRHGRVLVGHALRYLRTARFGLAEDEMVSVLGQRRDVLLELRRRSPHSPRADELPVAVWARLYADLAPYLAQRSGAGLSLLGFYHRVVGERAAERYGGAGDARTAHRELALFFGGRPVLRTAESTGETADPRTAAEMPFHLTRARMWKELGQTLGDLQFARAKCMAGMVHDLVNDYEAALQAGAKGALAAALEQFLAFVRRDAHTLGRYAGMPAFVEQQAHNFRRDGPVRKASAKSAGDRASAPWFKRLNVPDSNPVLQATMMRHTASALDCVFTPDGLHLLSCGNDGAIRMWTPDRWAHVKRVAQLPGAARSCDVGPDGSFVISAGGDGVIRRHDLASGEVLEFRHRVPEAERCRVSPDGDYVVACGEKGAVLFDVSGRKLWARQGVYYDVAFRGDEVAVLVGQDIHPIKLPTGATAGGDGVQARNLYGCAFSPDRQMLLVAGGNDTALYRAPPRRDGVDDERGDDVGDPQADAPIPRERIVVPVPAWRWRVRDRAAERLAADLPDRGRTTAARARRPHRRDSWHRHLTRRQAPRHGVAGQPAARLRLQRPAQDRRRSAAGGRGVQRVRDGRTGGARLARAAVERAHGLRRNGLPARYAGRGTVVPPAQSGRRLWRRPHRRPWRGVQRGVRRVSARGRRRAAHDAAPDGAGLRPFGGGVLALRGRLPHDRLRPPLPAAARRWPAAQPGGHLGALGEQVAIRRAAARRPHDLPRRPETPRRDRHPTDAAPRRSPARVFLLDQRRPPVLHRRARDRRHRCRARARRAAARLRQRDAVGLLRIWRPEALAGWRRRWRAVGMGPRHRSAAMGAPGTRWIGDRLRLLRRGGRDVDRRGSHALPVDAWASQAARRLLCGRGAFNLCGKRRSALHRRRGRARRRSHAGADPTVRLGARRCGGRRRSVGAGRRCAGDA